ncbi:MAG: rhomboid family intramembrane serine protease [Chlamydiales bacterium]|nr:rhomboid family intramembrane serine protease [Chlamydiales bacterium]
MRLICTINTFETDENPYEFSYYLTSQGVDNQCEELSDENYRIWVYEEDQVDKAHSFYQEYKTHPHDPRYRVRYETASRATHEQLEDEPELKARPPRRRLLSPAPYGPVSILVLLIVALLFIWAQIQRETVIPPQISGIIQAPILAPIERELIYDYPPYFQERDRLFTIYTPKEIEEEKPPPPEALELIRELRGSTTWMGIYDPIVRAIRTPDQPLRLDGPLFVKISEGEIWRIVTPAFLHFDLLHIFFNVLWFILLGNQIEFRLGWLRYSLLIVASAIVSNTSQYLMSGPFFMGLSGVVCALAAFIWARQQVAPWEGYLLHRFTLIFLAIFVIGMFLLQTVFFFLQIAGTFEAAIGIANTAHLTGALVGYLLGRMRFFSIRRQK